MLYPAGPDTSECCIFSTFVPLCSKPPSPSRPVGLSQQGYGHRQAEGIRGMPSGGSTDWALEGGQMGSGCQPEREP